MSVTYHSTFFQRIHQRLVIVLLDVGGGIMILAYVNSMNCRHKFWVVWCVFFGVEVVVMTRMWGQSLARHQQDLWCRGTSISMGWLCFHEGFQGECGRSLRMWLLLRSGRVIVCVFTIQTHCIWLFECYQGWCLCTWRVGGCMCWFLVGRQRWKKRRKIGGLDGVFFLLPMKHHCASKL